MKLRATLLYYWHYAKESSLLVTGGGGEKGKREEVTGTHQDHHYLRGKDPSAFLSDQKHPRFSQWGSSDLEPDDLKATREGGRELVFLLDSHYTSSHLSSTLVQGYWD